MNPNASVFDTLLQIFDKLFINIENNIFNTAQEINLNSIVTSLITLVIIFWVTKIIRQGDFQFPKNAIDVIVFLLITSFVSHSISNQGFLREITSYLDIPANTIQKFIFNAINEGGGNFKIGIFIENMIMKVFDNYTNFIPEFSILNIGVSTLLSLILGLVYLFFSFILIASIIVTLILNFLQIYFWKSFAIIMIPLVYFSVTRGMVFFWIKTIIALSLISTFLLVIGGINTIIENTLNNVFAVGNNVKTISLNFMFALIIIKIISITFIKEIPPMINGMLQTNTGNSTGYFANSITMTSLGATGAASAYGAFQLAMKSKNITSGTISTGKDIIKGTTGINPQTSSNFKEVIKGINKGIGNVSKGKSYFDK